MRSARVLLASMLLVSLGCTDEGRFSLAFRLAGSLASVTPAWLHVIIRDESGRVLGGDVATLPATEPLRLSIQNGDGRIAVAEVRNGPDAATARVLGYGISAPFSIRPDETQIIEVPVQIDAVAEISSLTVRDARGIFVADPEVELEIATTRDDLELVTIAQDPGFVLGRVELPVDGGPSFTVPYDLDAACRELDACLDGSRSVFVRVEDENGYPSASKVAAVVLDSRAPEILPGTAAVRFEAPGRFVDVTRADEGVTVRVSFALTEPVTSTPTVTLADSELPFTFEDASVDSWIFARTVGTDDPDGEQRPIVTARDRAGNEQSVPLGETYVVERQIPDPPAVETPDMILYRRAPWGDADDPQPYFEVVGEPGSVTPFAFIQIYDDPDVFDGTQVVAVRAGQTQADDQGAFRVRLVPVDRRDVYVLVVSASGSLHARTADRVRDVEWIAPATTVGSSTPPIHTVALDDLANDLTLDGADVEIDPTALPTVGGPAVDVRAPLKWVEHVPLASAAPDERRFAGTAYDWVRGRSVLVGGRSSGDLRQTGVWEWNGRQWSRAPEGVLAPTCNDGSGFGDDPFGYTTFFGALAETVVVCRRLVPDVAPPVPPGGTDELVVFLWNGATWRAAPLTGESPVGRVGHAIAYDPARRRVVLFGGNTGTLQLAGPDIPGQRETLDDTWTLAAVLPDALAGGTSTAASPGLSWTRVEPVVRPPPRDRAAMVYDPIRREVVMFGGIGRDRSARDDLWAFDGTTWREVPRSPRWPPARAGHAMVFDPDSARIGVIGGTDREPIARQLRLQDPGLGGVWWWDGAAWTETATSAATPAGIGIAAWSRRGPPLVVSPAPIENGAPVIPSETFEVTPASWRDRTPSDAAPPVAAFEGTSSTTLDINRGELVFHIVQGDDLAKEEETWRWSDSGWRRILANGPTPSMGVGTLVYDPVRDRVSQWARVHWIDGGGFSRIEPLRFYELGPNGWNVITWATGPQPVGFIGGSSFAGFDAVLGELVTFVQDGGPWSLWSWNGARWAQLDSGANFLTWFDEAPLVMLDRGRYFLHTRTDSNVYDGAWSPRPPLPGATVNSADGAMYDAGRNRLMSVDRPDLRTIEIHELSDAGPWVRAETSTAARLPQIGRLHYDATRRRLIGTSGSIVGSAPGSVSWLDVDPDTRPAVVALADLSGAGIAAGWVTAIGATVVAGGVGGVNTNETPGWALLAYDPGTGTWRTLGSDAANLAAPTRLDVSEDAADLVLADRARVAFAVAPIATRARRHAPPAVRVDQLVLRVRYRR